MTANDIKNRNNILDNLSFALKMAGYIESNVVRKNVEDSIVYCLRSALDAFNNAEKE